VICPSGSHTGHHINSEAVPNTAVVARLDRAIQYAAAYRSIAEASGILDHPPQCAIAHKAGDDSFQVGEGKGAR
jgi:hypothetical protein